MSLSITESTPAQPRSMTILFGHAWSGKPDSLIRAFERSSAIDAGISLWRLL